MYPIEQKPASRSTYHSPAEAKAYYGRYSREGITIHWWGDGTGASNHDNIVNFFLRRTDGSVNYVLSDNKITQMVDPDNVAWTSQAGNPTTISIEHQPTLGAEGYKKSGWLVYTLEKRYGRKLTLYPHKHWFNTACPGTIDINRIRQEADNFYNNVTQGIVMNQEAGAELYRTALFREPESTAGASQWNGQTPAQALRAVRGAEWQAIKGRLQAYDALQAKVAELSARPTKDELQAVVQTANTERDKVAVLEKALAEEKAKPPTKIEVVVEKEVIKEVEPSWLTRVREAINKFLGRQ